MTRSTIPGAVLGETGTYCGDKHTFASGIERICTRPAAHAAVPWSYHDDDTGAFWPVTPAPVVDAHLLDSTPVDDLEGWHAGYDPAAAALLDIRLDDFFGPTVVDVEWTKR